MQSTRRGNWLGIILIVLGGLFLLDNFGFPWFESFDIRHLIFSWHSIFLIIGIILLANHRNSIVGYIFLGIGLFGTLRHFVPFFFDLGFGDLWPAIFLIIGLWLILRRNEKPTIHREHFSAGGREPNTASQVYDFIDEVTVFNSINKIIFSENFRGGKVTTLLGGTKLDLTNAKLANTENTLEVTTLFGGTYIRVPQNWKILLNVTSVFGGFDDKRFSQINTTESSEGILIIKGVTLFGGGELLY
ncbi:MAG: DUF5668 domain-containing protein [Bacteroidota bacterium]